MTSECQQNITNQYQQKKPKLQDPMKYDLMVFLVLHLCRALNEYIDSQISMYIAYLKTVVAKFVDQRDEFL